MQGAQEPGEAQDRISFLLFPLGKLGDCCDDSVPDKAQTGIRAWKGKLVDIFSMNVIGALPSIPAIRAAKSHD